MKILNIIGARPQFIKAAVISRAIVKHNQNNNKPSISEIIIHTGQHFDKNMNEIFFDQMQIPKPNYNLGIHSLSHGAMTGRMMEKIEEVLLYEKPDYVLVYGDTNSTLAGALAAKKLHIKSAHIEAGLRSFNMKMPEEINRILTDRISDILFCPTDKAVENLHNEGFKSFDCKIIKCGDVMLDAAMFYSSLAKKPNFNLPDKFILATIHREENTDNLNKLKNIFEAFDKISYQIPIIIPIHPRTKKIIDAQLTIQNHNIIITEPVGYLEMIYLLQNSSLVITDSGGLQKEAFFFKKSCVIIREETEWTELVDNNYNMIAGTETEKIYYCYKKMMENKPAFDACLYGTGEASYQIIKRLQKDFYENSLY